MGSGLLDPLLAAFSLAAESEAEALLVRLLREEVEPVVDRVLGAFLGSRRRALELADLRGEVLLQLVRRLRALREQPGLSPIADLHGYVAVVTRNVCWEQLRRQHPERDRLRRRLWHVLRHSSEFDLFRDPAGRWLCRRVALGSEIPASATRARVADLQQFTASYLDRAVEPVAVADLLEHAVRTFGAGEAAETSDDLVENLPDSQPDTASELIGRDVLAALWSEIGELPPPQAAALLLGLREREGGSALILLPATGTAGIRQIAKVLGLSAENLAERWNDLPLPDLEIAGILGLSRQQVINLRKSARERLARRMKKKGLV